MKNFVLYLMRIFNMEDKIRKKYGTCKVFLKLGVCLLLLLISCSNGVLGETSDRQTTTENTPESDQESPGLIHHTSGENTVKHKTVIPDSDYQQEEKSKSVKPNVNDINEDTNLNNQEVKYSEDSIQHEVEIKSEGHFEEKNDQEEDTIHIEANKQTKANIKTAQTNEQEKLNLKEIVDNYEKKNLDPHKINVKDTFEKNHQNNIQQESVIDNNTTELGNNSSIFQWIKYFIDPFLEEFKDGIYSKATEKPNVSEVNISDVSNNETLNLLRALNITVPENLTDTDIVNTTDSSKKVKFQCVGRNVTDNTNATVKVITSARLLQYLSFDKNETENVTDCLLVMFYAPWCHFCAETAPNYNALARAFPQLDFVAVDTAQFSNLLARFGTVSVPNILVFHQSRAAVKFNQTERTFENFVSFVQNTTGLEPNVSVNVTETDHLGPVPSIPTDDTDYLLLMSWIFVIFCSTCMFVKSTKGQQWITRICVLWQEHQHID